jgi:DNA-binding MarR family transcriptional regulator
MLKQNVYSQPGHLIRRAHQLAWAVFMDETRQAGITPVQYAALASIADFPGIDATRLSELVSFDRATVGNVVERLETKGLIERQAGARDRRTKQIFLTAQGRALTKSIAPAVPRIARGILARLSAPEQQQLLQLLAKLVDIAAVEQHASLAESDHDEPTRAADRPRPPRRRPARNARAIA